MLDALAEDEDDEEEGEGEGEGDASGGGSGDEDDGGDFSKEEEAMLEAAIKKFGAEHGRPPTEVEVRVGHVGGCTQWFVAACENAFCYWHWPWHRD